MATKLNQTDLFILGLLKEKPMYGYEIKQIVADGHTERWARITQSAIYYSLRKLEGRGLVAKEFHQEGHLEQRIFHITTEGLEVFPKLIAASLASTDDLYPEYSIALMFRKAIDDDTLKVALLQRREFLIVRIAEHEDCMNPNKSGESSAIFQYWPGGRVTGERNLWFYRSELAWIDEFLAQISTNNH